MKKTTILALSLCVALCCQNSALARELTQEETFAAFAPVSLVELIARPEKFQGKIIAVKGLLHTGFEDSVLYFCREHARLGIQENGIGVEYDKNRLILDPPDKIKSIDDANDKYVLLQGKFDAKLRTLSVSRVMVFWTEAAKLPRRSESK